MRKYFRKNSTKLIHKSSIFFFVMKAEKNIYEGLLELYTSSYEMCLSISYASRTFLPLQCGFIFDSRMKFRFHYRWGIIDTLIVVFSRLLLLMMIMMMVIMA